MIFGNIARTPVHHFALSLFISFVLSKYDFSILLLLSSLLSLPLPLPPSYLLIRKRDRRGHFGTQVNAQDEDAGDGEGETENSVEDEGEDLGEEVSQSVTDRFLQIIEDDSS